LADVERYKDLFYIEMIVKNILILFYIIINAFVLGNSAGMLNMIVSFRH